MKKHVYFTCLATIAVLLVSVWLPAQTIFRDDFNRAALGDKWINSNYAEWSIVDGKAFNFIDGQGGTLTTAQGFPQTDYVIETKAGDFKVNYYRQYSIAFGKPDPRQDYGYIVKYSPYMDQGLLLGRSEGNEFYPVALDDTLISLKTDQEYTFKIEHHPDGLIQVFINDGNGYGTAPALQATDTTYRALGHFGWRVDTETYAEPFYVDWIEAHRLQNSPVGLFANISTGSGKTYQADTLAAGETLYVDRTYIFTSVPAYFNGAAFIKTANNDKTSTNASFLSFELTQEAHLYVFYDPRATVLPGWLQDWVKLPDHIHTTDPGTSYMQVYTRTYGPGSVTLGGNLAIPASGAQTNYIVAAVATMPDLVLQAEEATLTGAVVAANHPGYAGAGFVDYINAANDAITWSFEVPTAGFYQLAFKYALASGVRPLEVKVNGTIVASSLPFPATGAWHTWNLVSTGVLLGAGTNTVTLTATGSSGPNLDYLQVDAGGNAVLPASSRVVVSNKPEVRNSALLISNYPNPAHSSTTVWYELQEAGRVHLALYDDKGRQVTVLVNNEWQEAGAHQKMLNTRSLTSGLYFYRLRTDLAQRVGKMVVER